MPPVTVPPDASTQRSSFARRLLRALPLAILAVLFTVVLGRTSLFEELETTFLDAQMRLDAPADRSDVVIVDITEEDFVGPFAAKRSPLNPPVLKALLDAIQAGRPCVVGVDIDTHFPEFKQAIVDPPANVVWARSYLPPEPGRTERLPLDVLGGTDSRLIQRSGLPLTQSEKGVTRFYQRRAETIEGDLATLPWAMFEAARDNGCRGISDRNLVASTESLIIGYSRGVDGRAGGGRPKFNAGHILEFAKQPDWPNNTLIRDKIVIVGGSYLNEDTRLTPLGRMNGFEIMANVVETELRGGGVKPPGLLTILLLQIFDGFVLIALFHVLPRGRALLLMLPTIAILSLACSFVTYLSFAHWAIFAPVMIGVVLTFLFDEIKDHLKKRYKQEIADAYDELRRPASVEKET